MKKIILILVVLFGMFSVNAQNPDFHFNSVVIGSFASDPVTGIEGQIYWNSTSKEFRKHDGTSWGDFVAGSGASELIELTDVTSATPTNLYALVANGTSFVARLLTEADISDLAHFIPTDLNTDYGFTISDAVYGVSWDGDLGVASKNAIYDKIETLLGGAPLTEEEVEDIVGGMVTDSADGLAYSDALGLLVVNEAEFNQTLIPNTPSGNLTSTNVQAALNELQVEIDGIVVGGVENDVYGVAWDGDLDGASKNAIYDKIETLGGGSESTTVSDTAEIDLTLSTFDITADIVTGSIDETKLDASTNASLDLADSAMQPTVYDPASITEQLVGLTAAQTLTNKTLVDFTNTIAANDIHVQVRNESGGTINRGDAVYVSGYSVGSSLPLVSLADASSSATMPAFGLVSSASIANNANGSVYISGRLAAFDTSGFTAGDVLYVSNVGTAGNTLTSTKPTGTDLIEQVGEVLRSNASNGVFEIELTGIEDMPNVSVHSTTFLDNHLLLRNVANTFNGSFVNTNTADRIYTLQDSAGTLAFTSDITGTNSGTNTGDQTFTNSNTGVDHTLALSASGGSIKLAEGTNINLVTTGTASDGIVTINATDTGATQLDELSDVVSATNTDKFALMANGTTGYVGRALVEADISDLTHTTDTNLDIATSGEVNTGTNNTKAISPLALANSTLASNVTINNAKVTDDDLGVSEVYGAGWNGNNDSPTKNDVYDKIETIVSGGISNIVEDLTPELGGDLDILSQKITTSTVNGDIELEPNGTGKVLINDNNLELNGGTLDVSELTSGDPKITFTDPSFNTWSLGSDDSASTFTIENGISLATLPPFSIHHGNQVTTLNTGTSAITQLVLNQSGLGDSSMSFGVTGDTYSMGIDNSDLDNFKLSYNATVGVNDVLTVDTATLGLTAPSMSTADITTLGNAALITKEYGDANYGAGASSIFDLTDVLETTLTGNAQKILKVNSGETGFEYVDHTNSLVDLSDVFSATNTNRNVLVADGVTGWFSRALTEADISDLNHTAAGLANIVEDTTPQLGGALDTQGNNITSTAWIRFVLDTNDDFSVYDTSIGGGNLVFSADKSAIASNGSVIRAGDQDDSRGNIIASGDLVTYGGLLRLDNAGDEDTTTDYWSLEADQNFKLFNVTTSAFEIDDTTSGITAPATSIADINTLGNTALVTKEYTDATYASISTSPLEILNEGNGDGIVIAGRTAANFGNVGEFAFDISYSSGVSSTRGATAQYGFSGGLDIQNGSTWGFYYGEASSLYGTANGGMGYGNDIRGYGSFGFGTNLTMTGVTGDSSASYSFNTGMENVTDGDGIMALGYALDLEGNGLVGLGTVNIIRANSNVRDNATDQLLVIGNGTTNADHTALVRSNALEILKNANMTSYGDVTVLNDDTDTASPDFKIEQDGTGDAIQTITAGAETYTFGVDNSDLDQFKFSQGTSLTSNPVFRVGDSGNEFYFDANNIYHFTNRSFTTTGWYMQNSGTGDIKVTLNAGNETYTFGVDNSDDDKFKISNTNTVGSEDMLVFDHTTYNAEFTSELEYQKGITDDTTTAYELVLEDRQGFVTMDNASANTLTIPANSSVAFPIGTEIKIINKGAGTTTVAITTDTLTQNVGGLTLAQNDVRTLYKIGATTWVMGY